MTRSTRSDEEYLPGIPGSTRIGWVPPKEGFTKEEIVEWLGVLQGQEDAIRWNLGDMLNTGYVTLEDDIYQAYLKAYEPYTITRIRNICERFPIGKRMAPEVSIWAHEIVAPMDDDQALPILEKASPDEDTGFTGMTIKEIRAERERVEQEAFGAPETIEDPKSGGAPECPSCGAQSQHWHKVPAELAESTKRGNLARENFKGLRAV